MIPTDESVRGAEQLPQNRAHAAVIRTLSAGGDAQFGDTLFMAQVQFETGDPRSRG